MCREVCVCKVEIYEVKLMFVKKVSVGRELFSEKCMEICVLVNRFMEVRGSLGREIFVDLEMYGKRSFC